MAASPEHKGKGVIPVRAWPCGEGPSSFGAGSREGLPCSNMAAPPDYMGVIPVSAGEEETSNSSGTGPRSAGPGEGTSGSSGAEPGSHKRKRIVIKKWNAVARWHWDVEVANCAICRNHIMDQCIVCQATGEEDGEEDCTAAWGACNHAFHFHCISRWLKTRSVCPLDNSEWEFSKYGH